MDAEVLVHVHIICTFSDQLNRLALSAYYIFSVYVFLNWLQEYLDLIPASFAPAEADYRRHSSTMPPAVRPPRPVSFLPAAIHHSSSAGASSSQHCPVHRTGLGHHRPVAMMTSRSATVDSQYASMSTTASNGSGSCNNEDVNLVDDDDDIDDDLGVHVDLDDDDDDERRSDGLSTINGLLESPV